MTWLCLCLLFTVTTAALNSQQPPRSVTFSKELSVVRGRLGYPLSFRCSYGGKELAMVDDRYELMRLENDMLRHLKALDFVKFHGYYYLRRLTYENLGLYRCVVPESRVKFSVYYVHIEAVEVQVVSVWPGLIPKLRSLTVWRSEPVTLKCLNDKAEELRWRTSYGDVLKSRETLESRNTLISGVYDMLCKDGDKVLGDVTLTIAPNYTTTTMETHAVYYTADELGESEDTLIYHTFYFLFLINICLIIHYVGFFKTLECTAKK